MKVVLNKIINFIENIKIHPLGWVGLFLLFIAWRAGVERFFGFGKELEWWYWTTYIHYLLWYGTLILGIVLIIRLLIFCRIQNIFKIAIISLITSPLPLFLAKILREDVYNSNHAVLASSWGDLIKVFGGFLFGFPAGFGWGIKLGVIFTSLAVGLYIFLKASSVWKSVVGALGAYLLLIFLGSLSSLLFLLGGFDTNLTGMFISSLRLSLNNQLALASNYFSDFSPKSFSILSDFIMSATLFILFVLFLVGVLIADNRKNLKIIIKNMRIDYGFHFAFMIFLGMGMAWYLSGTTIQLNVLNILGIFIAFISAILFYGAAAFYNDIYDKEIDKVSHPLRPFVSGIFSQSQMLFISLCRAVLSLIGFLIVGIFPFIITLFALFLAWAYSSPRLRFRKIIFLNIAIIAVVLILFVVIGFFIAHGGVVALPWRELALLFLIYFLVEHLKDVDDPEGDLVGGSKTIFSFFGRELGKKIAGVFIITAFMLVAVFFESWLFILPGIIFGFLFYSVLKKEPYSYELVKILYVIYVIILVVFVALFK